MQKLNEYIELIREIRKELELYGYHIEFNSDCEIKGFYKKS